MDLCELLLSTPDANLRQRLTAVTRLLEVTRVMAAEVDPTKILEVIAAEACIALGCERATVYQYDEKRHELFTLVATELEISEIRRGLDQGISGFVARNRQMVNVADPAGDPRWNPTVDRATGFHTRSILAAPLTSSRDGALLGVLQCLNNKGGPFDRFDEQLLESLSQHAAVAIDRGRLVDELKRRQAIDVSLRLARDVQRGFMPERLPPIPGYEAATWWRPNQSVGGDYCDIVPLCDGRIGLIIADVSGHGLGPSLLMASARAALRALQLDHANAAALMELLAQSLAPDLKHDHFITMVVAALDPRSHAIEFANAGHAPADHYSAAGDTFTALEATGLPLGVLENPEYPLAAGPRLDRGDLIVLCTDGIVEAEDREGRPFGRSRLHELVRRHARDPLTDLVREIGTQVEAHGGLESPADDLTILAVRRKE